jgi:hypothetical protein
LVTAFKNEHKSLPKPKKIGCGPKYEGSAKGLRIQSDQENVAPTGPNQEPIFRRNLATPAENDAKK